MNIDVNQEIDRMIDIIYSIDQVGLDTQFVNIIDVISKNLGQAVVDEDKVNKSLAALEKAYMKRDLVEVADILLYEVKDLFC